MGTPSGELLLQRLQGRGVDRSTEAEPLPYPPRRPSFHSSEELLPQRGVYLLGAAAPTEELQGVLKLLRVVVVVRP